MTAYYYCDIIKTEIIKEALITIQANHSNDKLPPLSGDMTDEEQQFLLNYDPNKYDRPSVATDIVIFSMADLEASSRRAPTPSLQVLLVKRGQHPYKDHWALPGGFLQRHETIEECALREAKEETKVNPRALLPVGVFSDPERDIRTRVISHAFVSVVDAEKVTPLGGDDAAEAAWFTVSFERQGQNRTAITLTRGNVQHRCLLEETLDPFGQIHDTICDNGGLAFDHAKILAAAFRTIRNRHDDYDLVFRFLPEKFTLSSMQRVYEILNNIVDQPANFRRKIMGYVSETDEYENCVGHRPAKLFERKIIETRS